MMHSVLNCNVNNRNICYKCYLTHACLQDRCLCFSKQQTFKNYKNDLTAMKNPRVDQSANRQNHAECPTEAIDVDQEANRERENGMLLACVSNAVIYVLEATITGLLSPIFVLQWLSEHNYFLKLLRIIVEVALELLMLIVFAGVSIMTAAVLIYEEARNDAHSKKMLLKLGSIEKKPENPLAQQITSHSNVKSPSE